MKMALVAAGLVGLIAGSGVAADAPMDPAVARCVLENLNRAGWSDGSLLEKACRSLLNSDGGIGQPIGAGAGSYLVQCRVPTDPAWVEFRLITRDQCDRLNGTAGSR